MENIETEGKLFKASVGMESLRPSGSARTVAFKVFAEVDLEYVSTTNKGVTVTVPLKKGECFNVIVEVDSEDRRQLTMVTMRSKPKVFGGRSSYADVAFFLEGQVATWSDG